MVLACFVVEVLVSYTDFADATFVCTISNKSSSDKVLSDELLPRREIMPCEVSNNYS